MSNKTFLTSFVVALMVHVIFLLVGNPKIWAFCKTPPQDGKAVPKVFVPPIHKEKDSSSLEARELTEVVKPSTKTIAEGNGDLPDKVSSDTLPALRLIWDGPEQLAGIARSLNMRILAVGKDNNVIGELCFQNSLSIQSFGGNLEGYSNRVRTISAGFFGAGVLDQAGEQVHHFWVVVPASVDKAWVSVQVQSLNQEGLTNSNVSYMEGRIVSQQDDDYQLVITNIVTL